MANVKAAIKQVEVGSAPIDGFRPLLDGDLWSDLEHETAGLADSLRGRVLWNVNSTARGGGVAELLASLIPYDRGAGIDERWLVIEGSSEFFETTKKLHNLLHGVTTDGAQIEDLEKATYEQASLRNAGALAELMRPGDVAILHDPQTAGLIPTLNSRGVRVIWRSHIGVDDANDVVRNGWSFLRPYLATASAYVFSRRAYIWDGLDESRVAIISPCIDPFSTKNVDLTADSVTAILHASGMLQGADGEATFTRHDGTAGRVVRSVLMDHAPPPSDARIVLQVSRWDRLKDHAGVLEAFARHIAPATDAWLVLAGPAPTSVNDDPEQPEMLSDLEHRRGTLPPAVRSRVAIAQLPMEDTEENAAIVNALQRRADIVIQKSLAEGFGLTVAEAMWKGRPVVASRVGGIGDQIEDGRSGVLVDDPKDLPAFGRAVAGLLGDPSRASRLGAEARRRVTREFISPCHLISQARLVQRALAGPDKARTKV